ncbi:DNA/RNA helicase, superfamily II, SNF2 family [Desulfosporosinus orientis DSM 765]|uniref:DNA/RNA helicase, superfamily II, SNF2 family n=1 Tax=Desulfosporosinus orientis (strain ATCC 19365 / DSM 765 / NCIMB 8382 / VKM B-1628 / Singapore I) TaxID=768706 RepID=G7WE48_DESOD|nr:DEAD/DEAH box helicase [Desulfosporosinus orientis]AET69446.1 DNA/RNA helicase, superfamily II, SNF2 family [Desulfosporosinus orientis DSM 765]
MSLRFLLSEQDIIDLAHNDRAYRKGLSYHMAGRVIRFMFSPDKRLVAASVIGGLRYTVQLAFEEDGSLRSYRCSCPAFTEYSGACKHVIAVMKTAQERLPKVWPAASNQNQLLDDLFAVFASHTPESLSEKLTVNIELYISPSQRLSAHLQLKLGLQRLYVVKDIGQLLRSIRSGQSLEFGKQFTFEPTRQSFCPEDRPIIAMLQEMYDQHTSLAEIQGPYYSAAVLNTKSLPLTGYYLSKFLDALGDKEFLIGLESTPPKPAQIIRDGLPIEFSLRTQDQNLTLAVDSDELPLLLTPDGNYFIYKQEIYMATATQKDLLPSIITALQKRMSNHIFIPSEQKEFFASEALPQIKKLGQVSVEPILESKFAYENLKAKIYFDRASDLGITARLEFHYGETVINPFASSKDKSDGRESNLILIRSLEQERNILRIFEQAEFMVSRGGIHLEDDEKIFNFTVKWLPQLQNLAELYYSDQFKLKLRSSTTFSGYVRLNETLDILEVSFQYSDIPSDELVRIFDSLKLKKKYYRLRDGSFLDLSQQEFTAVAELINNLNLDSSSLNNSTISLPKYRALYIDSFLRQANLTGLDKNHAFRELVQNILEPQDGEFAVPDELQPVLRDYQKTGFKWLKTLTWYGLGGILADDMGLGKTLQVLSFILSAKQEDNHLHPVLVVAPTSLIYNWQEETKKFTPSLRVLIVEGTPQERLALLTTLESQWDIVVTSYPILRRDIDQFSKIQFSYCFLDEAQHTKNPQTLNAKSAQQIQAKGYFALTGTPVENSLTELWSLFNFIMPGYLLSQQDFRKKYEIPIIKEENSAMTAELSRHVSPFILRRLKKDVLKELPDKIESQLNAPMTEEQKKLYLAYLQEARRKISQEIASAGFNKSHLQILAALTRLRQICCHPSMFIENYTGESGKMLLLQEILAEALDSGHRILIFSQFTTMLDIIQDHLISENIEYFYLSGSTKASERMSMANAFNSQQGKVFLISLKAGGTGLNLTGADMVIHYDPWWNPAVEDQATDRAHRIGQENSVQVIKLIAQGTIEEKIQKLQNQKKALIDSVIQPGETMLSKLSEEELKELFDLG